MIAYKTFLQCPTEQRPLNIPLNTVWQQSIINSDDQLKYEEMNFTVVSEQEFVSYQLAHQSEYVAWLTSQTAQLTKDAIIQKITIYQLRAPLLINDLMATNTMLGISVNQSDQMFDDYADVLIRLSNGAFPTALKRLLLKRPSGFVTQNLIDQWIQKIQDAML